MFHTVNMAVFCLYRLSKICLLYQQINDEIITIHLNWNACNYNTVFLVISIWSVPYRRNLPVLVLCRKSFETCLWGLAVIVLFGQEINYYIVNIMVVCPVVKTGIRLLHLATCSNQCSYWSSSGKLQMINSWANYIHAEPSDHLNTDHKLYVSCIGFKCDEYSQKKCTPCLGGLQTVSGWWNATLSYNHKWKISHTVWLD